MKKAIKILSLKVREIGEQFEIKTINIPPIGKEMFITDEHGNYTHMAKVISTTPKHDPDKKGNQPGSYIVEVTERYGNHAG